MDKIVEIVEEILKLNEQKQEGQGIKILTPSQMLSRLPISLAELEAGNNSEKLKNEIRQLSFSLLYLYYYYYTIIILFILLYLLSLLLLKVYILKNGGNFYEYREK